MLKIKLALLSSFIISLIFFISCTDNPVHNKTGFQQSGNKDESCSSCWLVIFDHLGNNQPVPYAHVIVKSLEDNTEYFIGYSDENGIARFNFGDLTLPDGDWVVNAYTDLYQGHTYFSWDGISYKEVDVLMEGYE